MDVNSEITFDSVKKDSNGFVKILVESDGFCIPMLGKPTALPNEYLEYAEEVKRLDLTHWILKSLPEAVELLKSEDFGSAVLYYNSNTGTWKFYDDESLGSFDEDDDGLGDALDAIIKKYDEEFYRPYGLRTGNNGNYAVHAVYTDDLMHVR